MRHLNLFSLLFDDEQKSILHFSSFLLFNSLNIIYVASYNYFRYTNDLTLRVCMCVCVLSDNNCFKRYESCGRPLLAINIEATVSRSDSVG